MRVKSNIFTITLEKLGKNYTIPLDVLVEICEILNNFIVKQMF
jgi:hypothetical protein